MKNSFNQKQSTKKTSSRFKKILKYIVFTLLGVVVLFTIAGVGLSIYFNNHKTEIVDEINLKINENIKGHVTIGDVDYSLLRGFRNFILTIDNVVVKDRLWKFHKKTLLTAKEIEVHLNIPKLIFDNEVDIKKIKINDAIIHLYVDNNGLKNSDIFKPKPKDTEAKPKKEVLIQAINLENVEFISENIQKDKLFDFVVNELESDIEYTNDGFRTDLYLNTLARSMAFKLAKGSFIKDKVVKGKLSLNFSKKENKITVDTEKLNIGGDKFNIKAHFNLDKKNPLFDLDINTVILWKNAGSLLKPKIDKILSQFNIEKPIEVNCKINGNMSVQGEPLIVVKAKIEDNTLITPDGTFTDCSFNGEYNNTYKKGLGASDENSGITITNFNAEFKKIPISIPNGLIYNLKDPTATGVFKSKFDVTKINQFIYYKLMTFSEGTAEVNLKFNVNIVKLKINKPLFSGNVNIRNSTFTYVPKDLVFNNTDVALHFTEEALTIDNIKFTNKNNVASVFMKGKIDNFLDLYYNNPGKMIINWNIYSPDFDLKGFLAMLSKKKKITSVEKIQKSKTTHKLVSGKLQKIVDDCQVNIDIRADKMRHNKITGTNYTTSILLKNGQLFINNGAVNTCGGYVSFNAKLIPKNDLYAVSGNIIAKNLDLTQVLTSFDNFKITSFQSNDIRGTFSSNISLSGSITQNGDLINKSLSGTVDYTITNGALVNFEPLEKIGKVAFPNRNVKNLQIEDLNGSFKINGELVTHDLFKVSSNVLNFDVFGVYSFGKGTDIKMTIPLRDPKNDYLITNKTERENLRYKGIIANVHIVDGPDGKINIKLNPQNVEFSSPFKKSKKK